ncbi:uncharacterized protein LY79DRAFT_322422 [Colletotrichum navitas]|uniref:Uncharacterized protein n=1 Tax=Colletotrichum navitas TaxID=681940 RepID=A0AAD8Q8G6_9PEZI|nr:uncharacterized protein LY79DRAFT_322422 [Colletotrichum navitas]KAK1597930.1 hypothetical protein LY79DRAFT_322422 [Colletotrichum navitas]
MLECVGSMHNFVEALSAVVGQAVAGRRLPKCEIVSVMPADRCRIKRVPTCDGKRRVN